MSAGTAPGESAREDWQALAETAAVIAGRARTLAMAGYRRGVSVSRKEDHSPVTEIDQAIESQARHLVADRFPEHGFFGEEEGGTLEGRAEYLWLLDPIDGTRAYACGLPGFSVLLGVCRWEVPVLGLIDEPVAGNRWLAGPDSGCRQNGTVVRVTGCRQLAGARMIGTSRAWLAEEQIADYDRLCRTVAVHHEGGDGLAYGLLASGCVDLVVDCALDVWELLPVTAVVEAAGGHVVNWSGDALRLTPELAARGGSVIAAATPELAEAARRVLAGEN